MAASVAPSLKGIVSTNDDPSLCALCPELFLGYCGESKRVTYCCGKEVCRACSASGRFYDGVQAKRCVFCSAAPGNLGMLKKHAKKGQPWAQHWLAGRYEAVAMNEFEAARWYKKAAHNNHPLAAFNLSYCYFRGKGCNQDLVKARRYAGTALQWGSDHLRENAYNLLVVIAMEYRRLFIDCKMQGAAVEAKSVLLPLAEAGGASAQHLLGCFLYELGEYISAIGWIESAAVQGDVDAIRFCIMVSKDSGIYAVANFWLKQCKKVREEDVGELFDTLRGLKNCCGGCGAALLDGKMRKMCKGCKTYCYCDRKCQKLHWNRLEDGHRVECLEVSGLKKKVGEMKETKNEEGMYATNRLERIGSE